MAKGKGGNRVGGFAPQPPISYLVTYELFENLMNCVPLPPKSTKIRGYSNFRNRKWTFGIGKKSSGSKGALYSTFGANNSLHRNSMQVQLIAF